MIVIKIVALTIIIMGFIHGYNYYNPFIYKPSIMDRIFDGIMFAVFYCIITPLVFFLGFLFILVLGDIYELL